MSETRREDVTNDLMGLGFIEIRCEVCCRQYRLWFNGGELDYKECCGRQYALKHDRIHLVTTELPGAL